MMGEDTERGRAVREGAAICERWPPGHFIAQEMRARGWTSRELALRIGGDARTVALNEFAIDLVIAVSDKRLRLGHDLIMGMARAFGVAPAFFERLEQLWLNDSRAAPRAGNG